MNERELGAAKSAAESWINAATGRPLEGLLTGFSVRVAIYDAEGDVVFERKKGPYFARLIAEMVNEASGLDEPIPYLLATPELREEQKGSEPVDPFAADPVPHMTTQEFLDSVEATRAKNAQAFGEQFPVARAVEAVTQSTPEMLAEALAQK